MSIKGIVSESGNGFFDSEEFITFMSGRIEKTLMGSEEYRKLTNLRYEYNKANDMDSITDIDDDIEVKSENLCYVQG